MGLGGPRRVLGVRPPPFGGRTQTCLVEPALQGALGRQGRPGVVAFEEDADQPASPGGVLPAQGEGFVTQGVVALGAGATAAPVGGRERVWPLVVEAPEETADGARVQAEFLGDGGSGLLALLALPEGLAQRYGEGRRHGDSWCWVNEGGGPPSIPPARY
jgi:hypothetical protein